MQLPVNQIQLKLAQLQFEISVELKSILDWWMTYAQDGQQGFYGEIDDKNIAMPQAKKGLVLHSRILWTFSAAYIHQQNPAYLAMAKRAYKYLLNHFKDNVYGGMYWSVNTNGEKVEDKKQVYGIAFCIYGFSEYYKAANDETALENAKELFKLLEKFSYDNVLGGYIEAFSVDWKWLQDLRLSQQDANEVKTMNTHLHVLEAYTNLYRIWKDEKLGIAIQRLLDIFTQRIIDPASFHQQLFFNEAWELRSSVISFGHDIEASWLLLEAAEELALPSVKTQIQQVSIKMASATLEGLDDDGGLFYEYDLQSKNYCKEKHWWPQAEAMIGFFNAYQLTGDTNYLIATERSWKFIQQQLKDTVYGEWIWGVDSNGQPLKKEKAGFWKCPYHNGRACLEILHRILSVLPNHTASNSLKSK